jgi:hypothetical protein
VSSKPERLPSEDEFVAAARRVGHVRGYASSEDYIRAICKAAGVELDLGVKRMPRAYYPARVPGQEG